MEAIVNLRDVYCNESADDAVPSNRVNKATFGEKARKSVMMERFFRHMALRYKKASVTHRI